MACNSLWCAMSSVYPSQRKAMNLASAQIIKSLRPIPNADNIEVAEVLGWEVVVKKGEFKAGDLVCYIQIDTVVPEKPEFEFLRERSFRVRTIKLRKQISQGLIVPLPNWPIGKIKEGDDLTEAVGVKKFEKETHVLYEKQRKPKSLWEKFLYKHLYRWFPSLRRKSRLPFPTHIVSITDEERIQNMPHMLDAYKGRPFVIAEKLDGSSITIIHERDFLRRSILRVCSRRFELLDKENEFVRVVTDTNFKEYILKLVRWYDTDDIVVQGEYIGKPQGNRYEVENQIKLFNLYVNGKRINQDMFYVVCGLLHIPVCPFIARIELDHTLPEVIAMAEGPSRLNKMVEREGLVFRCIEDNFSFKAISNKYLINNNE